MNDVSKARTLEDGLCDRRILFIHISTFGYEISISDLMRQSGATVVSHSDRPYGSSFFKAVLRLMPRLGKAISSRHHIRWLHSLADQSFDAVFVLKGEGLSPSFLSSLRDRFPSIPFILYLWDSLRNTASAQSNLPFFNYVFSFDRADCESIPGLLYRPLFFTESYRRVDPEPGSGLFFLGTLNGDRPRVIQRVQQASASIGEFLDYWLFQRSSVEFNLRWLLDRSLRNLDRARIISKPMSSAEIAKRYSSARAILDIQHPLQSGMTMRTFEVLASGKKLITTNARIAEEPFFDCRRILIIDREAPVIPRDFLAEPIPPISEEFLEKYGLAGWTREVLAPVWKKK